MDQIVAPAPQHPIEASPTNAATKRRLSESRVLSRPAFDTHLSSSVGLLEDEQKLRRRRHTAAMVAFDTGDMIGTAAVH